MSEAKAKRADYDADHPVGWLYEQITGDEDARVCKDIPDSACRHQPRNFFGYLSANLLNKISDELASARLILPWLFTALGAPTALTGFLVPIREAGVLIPQLVVAAYIRRMALRKPVWLTGAALSGVTVLGMAFAALWLEGATAGWVIIGLLIAHSLARGLCSVSAKDVLGKTVSKTRRGVLMGVSASLAGVVTLTLGLYLHFSPPRDNQTVLFWFLVVAALLWVGAFVAFSQIREARGSTEGGGNALTAALQSLRLLVDDRPFRRFVITRSLLLSVALVPPFFVVLAQQQSDGSVGVLGLMIVASGLASALSAPVWGRLSDRSSRTTMIIAAIAAGVLCIGLWATSLWWPHLLEGRWVHALLFFLIMTCHSGVRLGRKVYLVDMATQDNRSAYVAISNTVIGVMMLAGGLVGMLADAFGTAWVILLLGVLSLLAALYSTRLEQVSG